MESSTDSDPKPGSLSSCTSVKLKDILQPKDCAKIIGQNKYEKIGADTQEWWQKKFESLEYKSTMPFYKRKNYLKRCFSEDTMRKLTTSGIEMNSDWGEDLLKQESVVDSTTKLESTEEKQPSSSFVAQSDRVAKEYTNPYLNFFKKSEKRAQIWRPQPKPTIETLPLILKAKQLEEKLATEFDEWFSQVGSKHKSEIDKEVILAIFEIMMSFPVATSMSLELFEIGSVPEVTAKFLGFPQRSESNSVQREIRRDIRAGNLKPMLVAFNQTLPIELRRQPFKEKLKEKWFEYQMRHQDLESMATVWRGITELHTTRVFINWLLDNPDLPTPPYFFTEGLLHYKNMNTLLDMGVDIDVEEVEEVSVPAEKKPTSLSY